MYVCMYVHMKPLDLGTVCTLHSGSDGTYIYIDRRHLDRLGLGERQGGFLNNERKGKV